MDLMRRLNHERGVTFVFSTHDPRILAAADRVVQLTDGRVIK
jgi:putative ABC transport system ATP-binding protein